MMKRLITLITTMLLTLGAFAQKGSDGLNARQFSKYWTVESESPDYRIDFKDGACEITAPKGLRR